MLFLVALILIGSVSIVSAQTSWWRTYGGTGNDYGYSVRQTADGGFIVAGSTFGAGLDDVYLIKTNASGDTLWTRTYGGTDYDEGYSVQQTSDGGYIVAGPTGGTFGDVYLIKVNASGDTVWTRTYGGTSSDLGYSVQQTSDSGYITAGYTYSFGAGNADVYLVKTDASGDTVWTRTYGGTDHDFGWSVQQTADSGYIIAGRTASFGAGNYDVYLIKTDASGNALWTRTYGGTSGDYGRSVQQTADGGYVIAGYTSSFGAGDMDVYLIKTNSSGDTLWTRTFGGTDEDWGRSVQQTADGGYIVTGGTCSLGAGYFDAYLIKTNAYGDTLWTRTYGGTGADWGESVQQTADGGYIVAGTAESVGVGSANVYLIKTDALGNVGVLEESPRPQVMRARFGTTVLSGAPGVRQLASCVAFDALGRRVQHPKPGIHFLRTEATAEPRKILLVE
jgi:hypothetical protein